MEYRRGFRKPSGAWWFERRAELSSEMMPANVGDAADVPPMRPDLLPMMT